MEEKLNGSWVVRVEQERSHPHQQLSTLWPLHQGNYESCLRAMKLLQRSLDHDACITVRHLVMARSLRHWLIGTPFFLLAQCSECRKPIEAHWLFVIPDISLSTRRCFWFSSCIATEASSCSRLPRLSKVQFIWCQDPWCEESRSAMLLSKAQWSSFTTSCHPLTSLPRMRTGPTWFGDAESM